jgi:hypothetical protein
MFSTKSSTPFGRLARSNSAPRFCVQSAVLFVSCRELPSSTDMRSPHTPRTGWYRGWCLQLACGWTSRMQAVQRACVFLAAARGIVRVGGDGSPVFEGAADNPATGPGNGEANARLHTAWRGAKAPPCRAEHASNTTEAIALLHPPFRAERRRAGSIPLPKLALFFIICFLLQ